MTAEHKRLELPEIRDFHEVKDAFARTVMILMAVTTLFGGVVEFFHSRAAVETDHLGVLTQKLGTEAMAQQVHADQLAQAEFAKLAAALEERTRRANTIQWALFQRIAGSSTDLEAANLERERLDQLIDRTERLSEVRTSGPDGPEGDPAFPDRFTASKLVPYWTLWAKQDAANEEFLAWQRQQSRYTTILTLYAAALYLFGLALAIRVPVRVTLMWVATGLVAFGTLWAGTTTIHHPWHMVDAETESYADAYAKGSQKLWSAHDPGEYTEGMKLLTDAIKRRPTFAQAYRDRAIASFQAGSPQQMGLPGVTDLKALEASAADNEQAIRLGMRTRDSLLSHGNNLFLLALEADPRRIAPQLRASKAETGRAIDLDPNYPLLHYNLAVASLASLDFKEAHTQAATAVALTLQNDGKTYRFSRSRQERLVAGALTDLESVFSARARLAKSIISRERLECEVRTLKEYIVGSVSMQAAHPLPVAETCTPSAPSVEVSFEAFPDSMRWYARLGSAPRDPDVLSVQWYHQDPAQQKWVALPDVSSLDAEKLRKSQTRPGVYSHFVRYLTETVPPSCVRSGRYRAELYLNGRLLNPGRDGVLANFAGMQAALKRDLNVAFCVPQRWQVWTERSTPGFGVRYRGPDQTGMLVMRIHYPHHPLAGSHDRERLAAQYLRIVLEDELGISPFTEALKLPNNFLGPRTTKNYGYRSGDTEIAAQAGVADDGAIIINVVYGPNGYLERGPEASAIFNSLSIFGRRGPDYSY